MAKKKPSAPLADAPTEELKPALTAENFHEHPDTPPDQLRSFVHMNMGPVDTDSDDFQKQGAVAKHPNLATPDITDWYRHIMGPQQEPDEVGHGKHPDEYDDIVQSLLTHKNAAPSIAEDYLSRTVNSEDSGVRSLHSLAASHPGVSKEFLKELVTEHLADIHPEDEPDASQWEGYKLPASFHESLMSNRGRMEPEEGQMTDRQIKNNARIKKLDQFIYGSYPRAEHDEQSLKRASEFYASHQPTDKSAFETSKKDFVENQQNLSSNDLEQILSSADKSRYSNEGLSDAVLSHSKISPTFVAKLATTAPSRDSEDYNEARDIQAKAIASPKLPEETRQKLIRGLKPADINSYHGDSSHVAESLLENKDLSVDDIGAIFKKGRISAMYHPNAPDSLVRSFYEGGDKNPDSTRAALKAANLPKDILRDIVASNKNQKLSVEALEHPNADMSVVEAGLKRKAAFVQEAASRHPLVAKQQIVQRLTSGKTKASDFIKGVDKKFKPLEGLDESNAQDVYGAINKRYTSDTEAKLNELGESPDSFWGVKSHLATSDKVPLAIKQENQKAVADKFSKSANNIWKRIEDEGWRIHSPVLDTAIKLANDGDVYTQNKWLKHPNQLRRLDMDSPKYDATFLSQAAEALDSAESKLPPVSDDRGNNHKREQLEDAINSGKVDLARNPHLPDELFNKITHDPLFLMKGKNWEDPQYESSRFRYGGDREKPQQFHTIFDRKWGALSDADKKARFFNLSNMGGDAATAVAYSRTAPTDAWLSSWQQLKPEDKKTWFDLNDITHYGDQKLRDLALAGDFHEDDGGGTAQVQAVKALNPGSSEDKQRLYKFLSGPGAIAPEGGIRRADASKIIHAVNKNFWAGPDGQLLIGQMMEHGNEDESMLAGTIKAKEYGKEGLPYLQSLVAAPASSTPASTPEDQQAQRWSKLLNINADEPLSTLNDIGKENGTANGKLDFLMNMPGDPDLASNIRTMAIQQGLISKDNQAKAVAADPDALSEALDKLSGDKSHARGKIIRDLIDSSAPVTGAILNVLAEKANVVTLNPLATSSYHSNPERSHWDATGQQAMANDFMSKFIDHSLKAENGPAIASNFLHNTTADDDKFSPREGALTKDMRRNVISSYIQHVESLPVPDHVKNAYLLAIQHQFETFGGEKELPASLMSNISKRAIQNNDVPTLMQLVNGGNASPQIISQLAKLSENPAALSDKDLTGLTQALSDAKTSDQAAAKITKAAQDRIFQVSAKDPVSVVARDMKENLVKNLVLGASRKNSDAMLSTALKYVNDPQVSAAAIDTLSHQLDSTTTNLNIKKIYNALPADAIIPKDRLIAPPPELINDPQALQQAESGWKLQYLANGIKSANKESADLITNRVMAASELDVDKVTFTKGVMRALNASPETAIKVFRSLPHDTQMGVLDTMRDPTKTHVHHVLPQVLSENDKFISNPEMGLQPFELAHLDKAVKTLDTVSKVLQFGRRSDNVPAVNGAYSDALSQSVDQANKIFDGVMARTKLSGQNYKDVQDTTSRATLALASLVGNWSGAQKPFEPDESMRTLDILRKAQVLASTWEANSPVHERTGRFGAKIADAMDNWINDSKVNPEDWSKVYAEVPLAKYALQQRNSIEKAALDGIDWLQYFNPKTWEGSKMHPYETAKAIVEQLSGDALEYAKTIVIKAMGTKQHKAGDYKFGELVIAAMKKAPSQFNRNFLETINRALEGGGPWDDVQETALANGVGGTEFLHSVLQSGPQTFNEADKASHWEAIAQSPAIDAKSANTLMNIADGQIKEDHSWAPLVSIYHRLVNNPKLPTASANRIIDNLSEPDMSELVNLYRSGFKSTLFGTLSKNPSLDKDTFMKLYNTTREDFEPESFDNPRFQPSKKFHPAFSNPRFGGELFRSLPVYLPKVSGFDSKPQGVVTKAEHSVAKDRLSQALQHIPPEGIAWAQFKKVAPNMEQWPEVKNLFMQKNNKPVMPEDIVQELQKQVGSNYHVTYATWDGAQRHREDAKNSENLVMQLNTSEKMEKELSSDPKLWDFYQLIQKAANHIDLEKDAVGGHPVTPHLASWVRIDTGGGKDGWIIEEFQSDFDKGLAHQIAQFKQQNPDGYNYAGHHYTCDEMTEYQKKIEKSLGNWHLASMKATEELAKKQGVKNLYLHGEGVRSTLSGMDEAKQNPIWLQEMYFKTPKALGWDKVDYTDYPVQSKSFLNEVKTNGRPTYCWVKKLS